MLLTILGSIVVACLPGAAVFRVPLLGRERRAALDAEERAFWVVVLSLAWSSAFVLALAALQAYTFGRLLAANLGLAAAIGLVYRRRLSYAGTARRPTATIVLPLALVALGCWLFFPPFEHVIGGKDPGVYVSEGIQIAQGGGLAVHDTVVSSMPASIRDLFFPFAPNVPYYCSRFMGFFVLDPARGTVAGQFPHLYPAWIAIAYGLSGVRGALATTPAAALLGLLAVYFTGSRLLGRGPALVAAVLLALNVTTAWFAREPNSEVVTQILLFGALLAMARSQVDGDRFFAPVAAVLLGLALFLRLDVVVALGGFGIAVAYQMLERRWPRPSFVIPLSVLGVGAGAYYLSPIMVGYMVRFLGFVSLKYPVVIGGLAVAAATVPALIVLAHHDRAAAAVRRSVPPVLVVAMLAAACYAYWLRMPGGRLTWHDARSLEVFSWYFPPLAIAAALAGYGLLTIRSFSRAPALLAVIAVCAFFVFYKMQIVPEHFWAARRFVPIILPGACLMVAACAAGVSDITRRHAPRLHPVAVALVALVVAVVGIQMVRAERPVLGHVEYAGMVARMDALAARFGPDDLLVINPRDDSDVHVLALPLNYIWNRPAVVLPSPKPDKALFRQFLDWARTRYRNIYFLGGGGTDLISPSIAAIPVFGDRFQLPEYEARRNAYPREVKRKEFDFGVYRFTKPGAGARDFHLALGYLDDLNVYRFHAKERIEGVTFRWSRNASYIVLPRPDRAQTLTLWLGDGGRPAAVPRAQVTVYLDGSLLGSAEIQGSFRPYTFSIGSEVQPAGVAADDAATVKIVSTTWNPRRVLRVNDDRDLGVMVQRVEIK